MRSSLKQTGIVHEGHSRRGGGKMGDEHKGVRLAQITSRGKKIGKNVLKKKKGK